MKNRTVTIITGEEMDSLSGQTFELDVHPMCDHSYILSEFIKENKIEYMNYAFKNSHDIVKMAILSNVVIFKARNFYLISLPDEITEYQLEKLEEYRKFIMNEKTILCLMSVKKEQDKISFQEYSTSTSLKIYEGLIEDKYKKWKNKQIIKTKYKDFPLV